LYIIALYIINLKIKTSIPLSNYRTGQTILDSAILFIAKYSDFNEFLSQTMYVCIYYGQFLIHYCIIYEIVNEASRL